MTNLEQTEAWNGEEGDRWTEYEDRFNRAIRRHGQRLLEAARVSTTDRALDVGCGCGESTRDIARAAASGHALGVDLSGQMIAQARVRSRAEGVANVEFEQADVQLHPFVAGSYDLAVSRFGVMFFDDPVAAFANIGGALQPGGRLAFVCWREPAQNEWLRVLRTSLAAGRDLPDPPLDGPGPFGLADPDKVGRVLGDAGFVEIELAEMDEPFDLGRDAADAFAFVPNIGMVSGLLADLDDAARSDALESLRSTLAAHEQPDGVLLESACWLVTATRH